VREDVVALTLIAKESLGLKSFEDMVKDSLKLF